MEECFILPDLRGTARCGDRKKKQGRDDPAPVI